MRASIGLGHRGAKGFAGTNALHCGNDGSGFGDGWLPHSDEDRLSCSNQAMDRAYTMANGLFSYLYDN